MRHLVLGLVLGFGCTLPATAQEAPLEDYPACTYDGCAIRIDQSLFSGTQIVRGIDSERVGRLSLFGSDLSEAVASSEQALVHARAYESKRTPAFLALIGGVVLSVAAGAVSNSNDTEALSLGLLAGGVGLTALGVHFSIQAQQESARAVWWHNRDLAR